MEATQLVSTLVNGLIAEVTAEVIRRMPIIDELHERLTKLEKSVETAQLNELRVHSNAVAVTIEKFDKRLDALEKRVETAWSQETIEGIVTNQLADYVTEDRLSDYVEHSELDNAVEKAMPDLDTMIDEKLPDFDDLVRDAVDENMPDLDEYVKKADVLTMVAGVVTNQLSDYVKDDRLADMFADVRDSVEKIRRLDENVVGLRVLFNSIAADITQSLTR